MAAPGLLAHRVDGHGEPLLLLNGGLMSISAWEEIVADLAGFFKVVRCDLRGQLLSPGEPPARVEGHTVEVVSLLDALCLPKVHVVGTSFGAEVGLCLGARYPERVSSLTAVTATDHLSDAMWATSVQLRDACRAAAEGGDGGAVLDLLHPSTYSPEFLSAQAEALAERRSQVALLPAAWFRGVAGLLDSLEGLDLRPLLGDIRCPALVVGAELDRLFPVDHSRALAEAIPGAKLTIIPGSGHALIVEKPRELLTALHRFVPQASQDQPGGAHGRAEA